MVEFLETPAGPVPRVASRLGWRDHLGTARARLGLWRDLYAVTPGLYAVGQPDGRSPVLVTANYKLSFDALRQELGGVDAWLLVVDTRGINVWCAAGKQLFSTAEVARRVLASGLERVVDHRRLVLPQLAATGVQSRRLPRSCGFSATFGPVRAADLPAYLRREHQADPAMRQVTFPLRERLAVTPVELVIHWRLLLLWLGACLLLSGIGPGWFALDRAWHRGWTLFAAVAGGALAGAVLVPLLLPWLPGRFFATKGLLPGLLAAFLVLILGPAMAWSGKAAVVLASLAAASLAGLNFTGSTPYTSPSGVAREMRLAMPWQAAGVVAAGILWLLAAWGGG